MITLLIVFSRGRYRAYFVPKHPIWGRVFLRRFVREPFVK